MEKFILQTNKGTFQVRYCFEKEINGENVPTLVVFDPSGVYPFTGKHGDEIPMMNTYKTQFEIIIIQP